MDDGGTATGAFVEIVRCGLDRSSGTIREGPSAYSSGLNVRTGTRPVCPEPIGSAALPYSKYRASPAQSSNRPSKP
ncbi:hypothetical protein [Streptomyces sp. NPDC088801]|uniref:hypothetical protein n=1 Tax=Streptomyces sp. NPDC088801 TaxID=3365903 RepID=UPI00382CF6A7